MRRALLVAVLLGLVGCSSETPPVTSSITMQFTLPSGINPLDIVTLELRVTGGAGVPPVTASAVGTRTRVITPEGGGATYLEIRKEPRPFLSETAEILLFPESGTTATTVPALTVEAFARRGDNTAVAMATITQGDNGQAVRFQADGNVIVPVALPCVLPQGCFPADAGPDAGMIPDAGFDDAGVPIDAGAPPDAGFPDAGPVVGIAGTIVSHQGTPIASARLMLNDTVATADSQGQFASTSITNPYTLTAAHPSGAGNSVVSWMPVNIKDVRAGLPPTSTPTAREMNLDVQHFNFADRKVGVVVVGKELGGALSVPLTFLLEEKAEIPPDGGNLSPAMTVNWLGGDSTEVVIVSSRFVPGDGGPTLIDDIGINKLTINEGVNITYNTSGRTRGTFAQTVDVQVAGGDPTLTRYYPMIEVDGVQFRLPSVPSTGSVSNQVQVIAPSELANYCPNCVQFIRVVVRSASCTTTGGGYVVMHSDPIDSTTTSITLQVPAFPKIISPPAFDIGSLDGGAPADAGMGTISPIQYEFVGGPTYDSYLLSVVPPAVAGAGSRGQSAWTTVTRGTLPDLRTIGAGMPFGFYSMIVVGIRGGGYKLDELLKSGRSAIALVGDFCNSSIRYGLPVGAAIGVSTQLVELTQ